MKTRDALGYFLAAVGFILLGAVISELDLWGVVCNWTVPWFCSAMALVLLIIFSISVVTGTSPSETRLVTILLVYLAVVLIGAAGIAVDTFSFMREWSTSLYLESLLEWIGLSVMLLVLLLAPRLRKSDRSSSEPDI